jgi:uncharacterized protein
VRPLGFDWNDEEALNRRKHRVPFALAVEVFSDENRLERVDDRFDYGEGRVSVIGAASGFLLHVTFTERGGLRWLISARRVTRQEREFYVEGWWW